MNADGRYDIRTGSDVVTPGPITLARARSYVSITRLIVIVKNKYTRTDRQSENRQTEKSFKFEEYFEYRFYI